MKIKRITCLAAIGVLSTLGMVVPSSIASANSGAVQVGATAINPIITGPAPVPIPASCPFTNADAFALNFVSGTGVFYGTQNKNGAWFGANAEGTAVFTVGTATLYTGHAHIWFGSGDNSGVQSQAEQGFTLDFHGSGPGGSITIHANQHVTFNANGTLTATVQNIAITCTS